MEATNTVDPSRDPRIATLTREVEALEGALRTGRLARLGLLALLVLFTLGMTWRFVSLAQSLKSEQNLQVLMKTGEKQFEQRMPMIRKELQTLVDQSSPIVAQAFYTAAKRDLPKYLEAIEKQREPLAEDLKKRLHDRLVSAYEDAGHDKIALLAAEIPEAADPVVQERVEAHFNATFARLIDKYYIEQLASQLETLFATWDQFPAEPLHADDGPLPDLVIGHLLEMASSKLSSSNVQPISAKSIPKRDSEDQPAADAAASKDATEAKEAAEPSDAAESKEATASKGDTQ